jgi:hypothetical protein
MNPPPDNSDLEALWKRRLVDSRTRWQFAREIVNDVREENRRGEIPSPDGTFAYWQALRNERLAWVHYRHVLNVFTALTEHGKIPDEKDWPPPIPEPKDTK